MLDEDTKDRLHERTLAVKATEIGRQVSQGLLDRRQPIERVKGSPECANLRCRLSVGQTLSEFPDLVCKPPILEPARVRGADCLTMGPGRDLGMPGFAGGGILEGISGISSKIAEGFAPLVGGTAMVFSDFGGPARSPF
ncbi:MAG: hypothetical protein ACM3NV_02665 [Syntrophothermus sp.]